MTLKQSAITALTTSSLTTMASANQETLAQKLDDQKASSKADTDTKAQMQQAIQELVPHAKQTGDHLR